ncbi:MAG: HAMP domain-containing sensor histidine kinase [Oscillospiraceae bacterium]
MKSISLKLKLSLWFTLILIIICIFMLAVIVSIYQTTNKKMLLQTLTNSVDKTASEIRNDRKYHKDLIEGVLADSDFFTDNVQIMIYDENREPIAGLFLYPELNALPLHNSEKPICTELNGKDYYCYDKKIRIMHDDDLYIRGIIPAENDLWSSLSAHSTILIAIPILLILAFNGGYFMTGRFLRPVKSIQQTAEEIHASGNLSKRIPTNNNGDELDELAQTINAMFEKLEKDFDAQKQFTSNASHELRTPVSVILAQCEYGFDHAGDAEELLQVVSSVQEQGYKMSSLIKLLLMFTRMEQGTEHYPKAEIELSGLLHSVCEDMRIIADKNITITESLTPVTAMVNQEMITLLAINLIQNAIRYGKENGTVKVSLYETEDTAILMIEDNGIGISAEDLPHIWERFYRSDKSRSSKGLGLGLALVRQIAEFHGGTTEAVSCENVGSCFTVKIPKNK